MAQDLIIPDVSPETEIKQLDGVDWVYYDGLPIVELGRKKALDNEYCHPEPGYQVGRCKMIKRDGVRCKNPVRSGWTVCAFHGAGKPSKPGGLTNAQVVSGRHAKHLPGRLMEQYEKFVNDPDHLSMISELALLDARMAEVLERLDSTDVKGAWLKVRRAHQLLDRDEVDEDLLEDALELLEDAMSIKGADDTLWKEIRDIVEQRRKVCDTERRRQVDAQNVMTYERANMLIAFLINSVQTHVKDPKIIRAISDDLKRVQL